MQMVRVIDDPLYQLIRNEQIKEFNDRRASGVVPASFELCDFRGLDLRGLDARGLDLRGAYFRGTDLRGLDLRDALLEGASIASAKISGCFFPADICAEEIVMSLNYGTRMRTGCGSG